MKTTSQKSSDQRQNSGAERSIALEDGNLNASKKRRLPRIDFKRRYVNRMRRTESLLNLLRLDAPRFYELAEVVGKWVWIAFQDRQPSTITSSLSELGFHWNKRRQVWQHPCGTLALQTRKDPRRIYGSYFAVDQKPA